MTKAQPGIKESPMPTNEYAETIHRHYLRHRKAYETSRNDPNTSVEELRLTVGYLADCVGVANTTGYTEFLGNLMLERMGFRIKPERSDNDTP